VLTAEALAETEVSPLHATPAAEMPTPPVTNGARDGPARSRVVRPAAAYAFAGAGVLIVSALIAVVMAMRSVEPPEPLSALYTPQVAQRIAEIAEGKGLPMPLFEIRRPPPDLDGKLRRFVGIWVSDAGWRVSGRQIMLIVAEVHRDGGTVTY